MQHQDPIVLATDLGADPSFVEVTIGLDKGRLLKSGTHIYFIAQRMGGWEVVEESLLSNVSQVNQTNNFMGEAMVIVTTSGRWTCKEITEGVDLRRWFGTKISNATATTKNLETIKHRRDSPQPASNTVSPKLDDIFSHVQSTINSNTSTSSKTDLNQDSTQNELDTFMANIQSDTDEAGSGTGSSLVKWAFAIWIFSSFMDWC
jgi:hypothetical protein